MTANRNPRHVSRRQFLKAASVLGGTVAAGPLLASCGVPGSGGAASGPLKIGVLLPYSDIYAVLGESITEGMKMYFESVGNQAGGRTVTLITEDEGSQPDAALQKARKLVEQDQVDLVAGVVSSGVALAMRDYFHDNQKFLILANAGAGALTRGRESPYIFRTSFSNWQPNWPMGTWAAQNIGKRAFISVPDYAAGKETVSAFRNSFEAAGGEVVGVQLTPFPNIGDAAPFIAELQAAKPDFVYAFYSGAGSIAFVKAYATFGLAGQIPLAGSGFMVEEDVLPTLGDAALGVRSGLHWALTLDNPQNKAFTAAYKQRTSKDANVFVMQGYDTARFLAEGLKAVAGDVSKSDALINAFANVQFDSPRGAFKMDPNTHNVINPIYVREVQKVGDSLRNVVVADLGLTQDPGDDSKDTKA